MTNAQAALIASASVSRVGVSIADIEARAERHMQWLDKQDKAAEAKNEEHKLRHFGDDGGGTNG